MIKNMWKFRNLPGEIIGITPILRSYRTDDDISFKDRAERGREIKDYLSQHPEITDYVIIDDDDDFLPEQEDKFVQTWHQYGLTNEVADKCIKILTKYY